jgi:hypothetical protein
MYDTREANIEESVMEGYCLFIRNVYYQKITGSHSYNGVSPGKAELRDKIAWGGEGNSKDRLGLVDGSTGSGKDASDWIVNYLGGLPEALPLFVKADVPEQVNDVL